MSLLYSAFKSSRKSAAAWTCGSFAGGSVGGSVAGSVGGSVAGSVEGSVAGSVVLPEGSVASSLGSEGLSAVWPEAGSSEGFGSLPVSLSPQAARERVRAIQRKIRNARFFVCLFPPHASFSQIGVLLPVYTRIFPISRGFREFHTATAFTFSGLYAIMSTEAKVALREIVDVTGSTVAIDGKTIRGSGNYISHPPAPAAAEKPLPLGGVAERSDGQGGCVYDTAQKPQRSLPPCPPPTRRGLRDGGGAAIRLPEASVTPHGLEYPAAAAAPHLRPKSRRYAAVGLRNTPAGVVFPKKGSGE